MNINFGALWHLLVNGVVFLLFDMGKLDKVKQYPSIVDTYMVKKLAESSPDLLTLKYSDGPQEPDFYCFSTYSEYTTFSKTFY